MKGGVNATPNMIGSSLGYIEDQLNTKAVLNIAEANGFKTAYADLEHVIFSETEGIFLETGPDQYLKADVFYKLFPWDWVYEEEIELTQILSDIITRDICTIVNPPYTTVWQNKRFLAYLTERYPNDMAVCETYLTPPAHWTNGYVVKPVLGRLGENVILLKEGSKIEKTKGDFAKQEGVYQAYCANPVDSEGYSYQAGVFVTEEGACALNYRCQEGAIVASDCEFVSHYLL